MKLPKSFTYAALALVLIVSAQDSLSAQVVETRESEGNPVVTVFRGSLYGAGTGLVLGGAWVLLESDSQDETLDILKWGTAGGAIAGATVGLLYVLFRSQPQGDADVVSPAAFNASDGRVDVGIPTLLASRRVDITGKSRGRLEARLLQATF
jgi:hypothetical protein